MNQDEQLSQNEIGFRDLIADGGLPEARQPLTAKQIQTAKDRMEIIDAPLVATSEGVSWSWKPADLLLLLDSHELLRARLQASEARVMELETAQAWRPIETAPKMRKVMVFYRNALGKGRCVLACYYKAHSLEMEDDYAEVGEYDEATGASFAPEGWYEEHEHESPLMPLSEEPTHWMPLPDAPALPAPPAEEGRR